MTRSRPDSDFPTLGAEVVDGGTRFAVFATDKRACQVRLVDETGQARATHALAPRGDGLFQAVVPGVGEGALYDFLVDDARLPDPYARFLPRGVDGPAMVTSDRYAWRHGDGVLVPAADRIIYELHVGTFTPEGTYAAAGRRLGSLVELGVTAVELMPLAAFAGRWGWGYDGVAAFAPYAPYGTPAELRAFVDEAHGLGLAVILDVVYNHLGPAGNYLPAFSTAYFTAENRNAWGDALDFRHPVVRRYVLDSARMWLTGYRFDGLRLDATHAIVDPSKRHILQDLAELAHGLSPRKFLIAEDERNDPALVREVGVDAQWADDFHHAAHVTVTGERDGYYGSYAPGAATLADSINRGWLYEGQVYPATGKQRGKPAAAMPAEALVYCLQNHDQIGNRAFGERLWQATGPAGIEPARALAAVLLFVPMTPMLFMGQEWGASTPFQFFTDHDPELGEQVSRGRREEFKKFSAFSDPAARDRIPDPQAPETFQRSKLKWDERASGEHARTLALYKDLIRLRRQDPVLRDASRERLEAKAKGALLVIRRWGPAGDRVLVANLGANPVDAAAWADAIGGRRVLLRTDGAPPEQRGALPGWTAVLASGTGAS